MTYIFRPGASFVTATEQARVYQPGGAVALPWWNPDGLTPSAVCGAWQAKGAASLAASYLNLATLGYANIDPAVVGGVAPGWAAGTGWTFNGINQYLKTGIISAPGGYSLLVQFSSIGAGGDQIMAGASSSATTTIGVSPKLSMAVRYYWNGSATSVVGIKLSGNMGVAGQQGYYNGVPDLGIIPAWVGIGAHGIAVGALNNAGAISFYFGGTLTSVAIYNVTLTAPQVLARATAMAAL